MVPINEPKSIYLWMVPNGYLNLDGEAEWFLVENIDEMLKKILFDLCHKVSI